MFIKEGFIKEGFIRSNPSNLTNCGGNAFVKEGFIKEGFIKSDGSCGGDEFVIKTITIPTSNAQSQSKQKILSFLEKKETNKVKLIANLITPNAVWVIPSAFLQSKGLKTYENKSFRPSWGSVSQGWSRSVEHYIPLEDLPDDFTQKNTASNTRLSNYSESQFVDKNKPYVLECEYYDFEQGKKIKSNLDEWGILFALINKIGLTELFSKNPLFKEWLNFPKYGKIECAQIGSYLENGEDKPLYEKVKSGQEAGKDGDISVLWNYPTKTGGKKRRFLCL